MFVRVFIRNQESVFVKISKFVIMKPFAGILFHLIIKLQLLFKSDLIMKAFIWQRCTFRMHLG